MIDKFEFYHGAALVRVMDDRRCKAVSKHGLLGYVVNQEIFVLLKYTAKSRSPWGFTFDLEDILRCVEMKAKYSRLVVGLICAGDGICALEWAEVDKLLNQTPGRIAAGRKHNESYAVWGTAGEWKRKISLKRWPELLFA